MHLIIKGVREVTLDLVEEGAAHDRHLVLSKGPVVVADVIQVGAGIVTDVNGVPGVSGIIAGAEHQLRACGVYVARPAMFVE